MPEPSEQGRDADSLDIVEVMMAVEEAIGVDESLSPAQRERLLREIEARIERGEIGDLSDLDEGALGVLDDRSVESYPIEHFRGKMVYAIRHEATTLDPVGGGAESTRG